MQKRFLAIVATLTVVGSANATLLSYYNFNDASTSGTSAANAALLMSADGGSLKSTTSMSTSGVAIANVVSFGGTITNSTDSVSGAALAIQGGTNNANNGGSLILSVNSGSTTQLLTGLNLSFAGQRTSTGFSSYQLAYSINGGAYTNFGSTFDLNLSTSPGFGNSSTNVPGAIRSFDLSGLTTAAAGAKSVDLKITFTGASTTSGNLRLDNVQLNGEVAQAVPEPASIAALGLGLVAVIRRRRASK